MLQHYEFYYRYSTDGVKTYDYLLQGLLMFVAFAQIRIPGIICTILNACRKYALMISFKLIFRVTLTT